MPSMMIKCLRVVKGLVEVAVEVEGEGDDSCGACSSYCLSLVVVHTLQKSRGLFIAFSTD